MAVAKRRQSRSRRDSRRSEWMKVSAPSLGACPHCGEARLAHQVCPHCGKYGPSASPRDVLKKSVAENSTEK